MRHLATLTFLAIALVAPILQAQDPAPEPPQPAIKKINDAEYKIGKVHLNKATREISFGAGVNLTNRAPLYIYRIESLQIYLCLG